MITIYLFTFNVVVYWYWLGEVTFLFVFTMHAFAKVCTRVGIPISSFLKEILPFYFPLLLSY